MPPASITDTAVAFVDVTAPESDRLVAAWATSSDRLTVAARATPMGQRRSLAARALLRVLLHRHVEGYHPGWEIVGPPEQPPRLVAEPPSLPAISLSHSRNFAAAAFAFAGSVGVDIEKIDSGRPVHDLARAAFGPVEVAAVDQGGASAFYRIWTVREALAKATGQGFRLAANGLDLGVSTVQPGIGRYLCLDRAWDIGYWDLAEGYGLSVVLSGGGTAPPALAMPFRFDD